MGNPVTELVILRHGETDWNAEGRIQGYTDIPLNENGLEQAREAAAQWRGAHFDRVYASTLARAVTTAEIIAAEHGLEVLREARLREWNLGILEGLTYEDVRVRHEEAYRMFKQMDPEMEVTRGESRIAFYTRTTVAFEDMARRHAGERLLVVCHGGVINNVLYRALGLPLSVGKRFLVGNAWPTTVTITREDGDYRWQLLDTAVDLGRLTSVVQRETANSY